MTTITASKVLGNASEQVSKKYYIAKVAKSPDARAILDVFAPEPEATEAS